MKIVQLLKKERVEIEYDDMLGFLTKEDLQKLREATQRPRSPQRKMSYTTWICALCRYRCFYKVKRCPACESSKIEQVRHTISANLAIRSSNSDNGADV